MRRVALALVVAFLGVTGCGGWQRRDVVLELPFMVGAALDARQTQDIAAACSESNPIIGHCGQRVPPGPYFLGAVIAHFLVSAALPAGEVRLYWQGLTTGAEWATVWKNYGDGVPVWP